MTKKCIYVYMGKKIGINLIGSVRRFFVGISKELGLWYLYRDAKRECEE
jgi:hypothetical protein